MDEKDKCDHRWRHQCSGHAMCLECEAIRPPVKFPPERETMFKWKKAYEEEAKDHATTAINLQKLITELEQKLSDSEADWLKMRDIAEETQRKLDEAIEVIRFYADDMNWAFDEIVKEDVYRACGGKRARDFLAKIEGKNDEPCNHRWQYFASGHALCLNCEETKKPVKFPTNKEEF